jgi:hypothetical protein
MCSREEVAEEDVWSFLVCNQYDAGSIETLMRYLFPSESESPEFVKAASYRRAIMKKLMHGDFVAKLNDSGKSYQVRWTIFLENKRGHLKAPAALPQTVWGFNVNLNEAERKHVLFYLSYQWENVNWFDTGLLVIRKQTFNNCYLHAPVTLLHYLIVINSQGNKRDMIDISAYELEVHKSELADFIINFGGRGGKTLEFLYGLLGEPSWSSAVEQLHVLPNPFNPVLYDAYVSTCDYLIVRLETAPGLISEMLIEKSFLDISIWSHDSVPSPVEWKKDTKGASETHSMMLIGGRKVMINPNPSDPQQLRRPKYFFLLQNWYTSKFFVEVSGEYLYQCAAKISFVDKIITSYPSSFPLAALGSFYETCINDDECCLEGRR